MNIFLYIIIFIMGTVFGSFYTLAIYRIPNKIDITHTHSFCPNCKHKLGFFELIPVWSYIFLGGKCKECKQKIRPRYFIIEICSGLTFVLIAILTKLDFYNIDVKLLIELGFLTLYLSAIAIIAGIDKEKRQIQRSVIYYALGISLVYIIYLCIIDKVSIYRYVMYLAIMLILLIIDTVKLKTKAKTSYIISILILLTVMALFTGEFVAILTITMSLLIIAFYLIFKIINNRINKAKKDNKVISNNLPIAFCICVSNVIMLIFSLLLYT